MSAPVEVGLTVADLDRFPEDDGFTRELIDGELYVRGAASLPHQEAAGETFVLLRAYARRVGGRAWINPGNVLTDLDAVIPDVAYVCPERLAGMDPAHIDRAADLIVEVGSPGTRRIDLVQKRDLYEREGVPEYWFVDLDACVILVHRLQQGRYGDPIPHGRDATIIPAHLPGLAVAVADVLA